jgi:pimeloyl-ACP methyl ester carboxylesterase
MSTIVLVHGAWHGAWCWYKVVPALEKAGHRVIAPDLAGLGKDGTPLSAVTLAGWAEAVCDILDAEEEPVLLVGHSRAGIVISEVAERRPDRIRKLVYLSAFLVPAGQSLFDVAGQITGSVVTPNLIIAPDQVSFTVHPDALREGFYGDSSDEDFALAQACLRPEPVAPCATPLQLTGHNFGRVPRVYIECLRDRAITPDAQRRMYTALPCRKVLSLDADHSAFFSRPAELVSHLLSL